MPLPVRKKTETINILLHIPAYENREYKPHVAVDYQSEEGRKNRHLVLRPKCLKYHDRDGSILQQGREYL